MQALKIDDLSFVDEIFELSSKTKAGNYVSRYQSVYYSSNQAQNLSPQEKAQLLGALNNLSSSLPNIDLNNISVPELNSFGSLL